MTSSYRTRHSGFTLIEMIISLAIFSIVAVVALGALVRIISANQKAQSLQSSLTNLNFGLESMSRELRVGTRFHCVSTSGGVYSDPNPGADGVFSTQGCDINNDALGSNGAVTVIAFISSRQGTTGATAPCNLATAYRFINVSGIIHLQKAEQRVCGAGIRDNNFADVLSSQNIVLTDYRLGVGPYDSSESNSIDGPYPRVFVRLIGYAGIREREKTFFDIQTTVSQRTPKQ